MVNKLENMRSCYQGFALKCLIFLSEHLSYILSQYSPTDIEGASYTLEERVLNKLGVFSLHLLICSIFLSKLRGLGYSWAVARDHPHGFVYTRR